LLSVNDFIDTMAQGKRTVSDAEIVAAIAAREAPFVTSAELANQFGMTRQWAHNRLSELHQDGLIARKKSGARSVIWWLPDD
jgi:predicted transcriptional regulator